MNSANFSAGTAGTVIYVVCDNEQSLNGHTTNANEVAIFVYAGGAWRQVTL
jgi:hypothetical protein